MVITGRSWGYKWAQEAHSTSLRASSARVWHEPRGGLQPVARLRTQAGCFYPAANVCGSLLFTGLLQNIPSEEALGILVWSCAFIIFGPLQCN